MSVSCSLEINWSFQIKHVYQPSRPKLEIFSNQSNYLFIRYLACAEGVKTDMGSAIPIALLNLQRSARPAATIFFATYLPA